MRTARNVVQALLKMSVRSYTYQELSAALDVGYKTSVRIVDALEVLGCPIVQDERENGETGRPCSTFRIDRHWAQSMLKVSSSD